MFRWHILAGAAVSLVAAAAFGYVFRPDDSTDQKMELTAAETVTAGAGHFTFTVAAAPIEELYPGAVRRLKITLINPYKVDLRVNALQAELVATSNAGCEPVAANLEVQPYTGTLPVRVDAGDSEEAGVVPLHMPNTVANECQKATFSIRLNADAVQVDGR